MSTPNLIVVIVLACIGGVIVGGALQVFIIRIALDPLRWDLERIADRIAPERDV